MSLLSFAKRLVPTQIKESIKESRRRRRFKKAFDSYKSMPISQAPSVEIVGELVAAWGNEGYSAVGEYIFAFIEHARQTPGPIVECGSGLSTLMLGVEAQRRGLRVWTLEHHPEWAKRMRAELNQWGITSVELCHAPLKTFDGFAWYDAPLDRMPNDFALAICDGPPGDTLGGRYGMLPTLRHRFRPGCVILLDDYERADEQAAAARWVAESNATLEKHGDRKPYALLRLP